MDNDYHSPYDLHGGGGGGSGGDDSGGRGGGGDGDTLNHYEAPSMLARNPSGSLYIPSGTRAISTKMRIKCPSGTRHVSSKMRLFWQVDS